MFCQKCGKTHEAVTYCPYCNTKVPEPLVEPPLPAAPDTKENRIIRQKIQTKKEQIDRISQIGPTLLVLLGFPALLLLIIPGLILIGIGIWWGDGRENEKLRLENEIKELELELS